MMFFICAPSYDENSGGAIVLHRLCHLLNEVCSGSAYLVKQNPAFIDNRITTRLMREIKWNVFSSKKYKTKSGWNTPVWEGEVPSNEGVVVYPEIVNNNPLKIKNVVRWLLHQPGFHTKTISYNKNELYFKFNSAIKDFSYAGSVTSKNELKIIYYPIDIYYEDKEILRDIECCYLIRKGGDKKFIHPSDAVNIDGLAHSEVADIFRRSKKFICYDDYTAYSIFAVLCGCDSFVVPGDNISLIDWYPNEKDRYGISYGFNSEQLDWACKTKHKVLDHILKEHERSFESVKSFVKETQDFFDIHN